MYMGNAATNYIFIDRKTRMFSIEQTTHCPIAPMTLNDLERSQQLLHVTRWSIFWKNTAYIGSDMPNGPNAEKKFVQVRIKAEFEVNRLNLKVFAVNAHEW